MDLDEIKQLLDLMRENDLAEVELEQEGVKIRLRKQEGPRWSATAAGAAAPPPAPAPAPSSSAGTPAPPVVATSEDLDLAIVKSPIVGTFFRSSEPGAAPFTDVGQQVEKGQVLCIIEAMKLMNEINAECDGEVVQVYVENGQAVQYGERLFALKPA